MHEVAGSRLAPLAAKCQCQSTETEECCGARLRHRDGERIEVRVEAVISFA